MPIITSDVANGLSVLSRKCSHLTSHMVSCLTAWLQHYSSYPSDFINVLMDHPPDSLLVNVVHVLFNPRLVAAQLAALVVLQSVLAASVEIGKFSKRAFKYLFSDKERKRISLLSSMETCSTYVEWQALAEELDKLNGLDGWKRDNSSDLYDESSIRQRIADTRDLISKGDVFELMFRMRGGLARNQFGIQNERLFTKCKAGTKKLVLEYHNTITEALDYICDSDDSSSSSSSSSLIRAQVKLAFFNETRYAFGRTAILLSGGASLGYYHLGVIYALFKANLLPRIISGSSAGSIMAAVVGTKTSEEYLDVLDKMMTDNDCDNNEPFGRSFFKFSTEIKSPVGHWLQSHTPKYLKWIGDPLLGLFFDGKVMNVDSKNFRKKIRELIGTQTFQEAFDKTSKIINITVAPVSDYDSPRLLNYLTAPHVCVWSAVVSSCSIPGVFDSSPLVVKTSSGGYEFENVWTRSSQSTGPRSAANYSDGSLETDLPMKQLSELFNVNHFIVSQVNPHSLLLSSISGTKELDVWSNPLFGFVSSYMQYLRNQCKYWCKSVMEFCGDFLVSARKGFIAGALLQDYTGASSDITIFPWKQHRSLFEVIFNLIKNPGLDEFRETLRVGEASAWSHMERIRANCHVELTLDRCINRLRRRIAGETHGWNHSISNTAHNGNGICNSSNDDNTLIGSSNGIDHSAIGGMLKVRRDSFVLENISALTVSDPLCVDRDEYTDDDSGGSSAVGKIAAISFQPAMSLDKAGEEGGIEEEEENGDDDMIEDAEKGSRSSLSSVGSNDGSTSGSPARPQSMSANSGKNHDDSSKMKKSTNMTQFYYARSNSSEKDLDKGWQGF